MTVWRELTLADLVAEAGGDIQTGPFGSQLHAADYVLDGTPVVMPQNIGANRIDPAGIARVSQEDMDRLRRYWLTTGDIVYSRRGDVERRALVRPENDGWLCGTGCLRVRIADHDVHDPTFISYALGESETRAWITRHAVGATMLNLNTSILGAVPLRIPTIDEQRAIAEVLGALDDKIAANDRLALELTRLDDLEVDRIAQAAVHSRPLEEIAEITTGISYRSVDLGPSDVALATLKCVARDGSFTAAGYKEYQGDRKAAQVLRPGETVVAMTDLTQKAEVIGWCARVPDGSGYRELVASLDLGIIRARDGVPDGYLLGVLRRRQFRAYCRSRTTGTTVLHLSRKAIKSYPVPLATDDVMHRYAERTAMRSALADSRSRESQILVQLRDLLLPALMSGRLTVKEAEATVSEAI